MTAANQKGHATILPFYRQITDHAEPEPPPERNDQKLKPHRPPGAPIQLIIDR
jgi:hypothetical protein